MRTEFGFERSMCSCDECIKNCKHISGYLIPADLKRWIGMRGPEWTVKHLMASPGAQVLHEGKLVQVPTLVPLRRESGRCVFLTSADLCAIHEISPYGCAFFGHETSPQTAQDKSWAGVKAVMEDDVTYRMTWFYLWNAGIRAECPSIARKRMKGGG